jgi:hypothetical protein
MKGVRVSIFPLMRPSTPTNRGQCPPSDDSLTKRPKKWHFLALYGSFWEGTHLGKPIQDTG